MRSLTGEAAFDWLVGEWTLEAYPSDLIICWACLLFGGNPLCGGFKGKPKETIGWKNTPFWGSPPKQRQTQFGTRELVARTLKGEPRPFLKDCLVVQGQLTSNRSERFLGALNSWLLKRAMVAKNGNGIKSLLFQCLFQGYYSTQLFHYPSYMDSFPRLPVVVHRLFQERK